MQVRVLPLVLATFAVGTESFVFAGLLTEISQELEITVGDGGLLATSYAFTFAICAPLLASYLARFERRLVLTIALFLVAVTSFMAAFAPTFFWLIVARILCGMAATQVFPVAIAMATQLSEPQRRGSAIAMVMGGMTVAFVIGVPAGTFVGDLFGWRACFIYAGLLALVATFAIRLTIERVVSSETGGVHNLAVLASPRVFGILITFFMSLATVFIFVAYLGPVVNESTGLHGWGVGVLQMTGGFGSIIGLALGGKLADRGFRLRYMWTIMALHGVILAAISVVMLAQPGPLTAIPLVALILFLSSAVGFSFPPILQYHLQNATPNAATTAAAASGSMVFAGQGTGALIGGAVIDNLSIDYVGFAAGILTVVMVLILLLVPKKPVIGSTGLFEFPASGAAIPTTPPADASVASAEISEHTDIKQPTNE